MIIMSNYIICYIKKNIIYNFFVCICYIFYYFDIYMGNIFF